MYPIFFSVASEDVGFAGDIWENLPDDWVYLYSKTGVEGAHMWEEISRQELPKSRVFVVFWSENYPRKQGCVREIRQAQEIVRQGRLLPVVLRLDKTPISWDATQPDDLKPVFDALADLIAEHRTSDPCVTVARATDMIGRAAEPILQPHHPVWPRTDLLQTLRKAIRKDRFSVVPAVWISGFNGVGRESLVREFNRNFTPNGRGVVIDVNEAALPRQILLRIEGEAFGLSREELERIVKSDVETTPADIATAIQRVFDRGDYLILRHNRIVQESIELPEWLDETVTSLSPATRCKLFIISQLPLMSDRRARCGESLVAQRVPTLDEQQMEEFAWQLVGHFDNSPARWTEDDVAKTVAAAGGNVGFIVSLVRNAARLDDLDQLTTIIAADSARMAESISVYIRWAFSQLRDLDDEQKALIFLEHVSPCHIEDLAKTILPTRSMLRVLGRLTDLGLVERETEGLYRLTPQLANRMNQDLIRPELLRWLDDAMRRFAASPVEFTAESEEDGHEYVRLEARIQASLLSGSDPVNNGAAVFVSASHWFQAGIRLYHLKKSQDAYRLLKRAYQKRAEFSNASRVELVRYFCLSATRNRKYPEAEACIQLLEGVHTTKPLAAFLRADLHEYKREFPQAISEYERALQLNIGRDTRLERTYRPLIRCILASQRPDFAKAERFAQAYVGIRRTIFSLMSLTRVYLHWKHRGVGADRSIPDNIDDLLESALSDLKRHPGSEGAWFEMLSEQAEFSGAYPAAIEKMDDAIRLAPRFQSKTRRWRLMVKSNDTTMASKVIDELEVARKDPEMIGIWQGLLPMLADLYARALRNLGRGTAAVNSFAPELLSDEIGRIITRSKQPFDSFEEW